MKRITARTKLEYYRRSYEAIDGLWFMMIEGESGFERALEIDRRVWEVVPKIQARRLRDMLGITESGLAGLSEALVAKFAIDGFACSMGGSENGRLVFEVRRCPWYELMKKAGRDHLAGRVGEVICPTEYQVWAREFGKDITFSMPGQLCNGRKTCTFEFAVE